MADRMRLDGTMLHYQAVQQHLTRVANKLQFIYQPLTAVLSEHSQHQSVLKKSLHMAN